MGDNERNRINWQEWERQLIQNTFQVTREYLENYKPNPPVWESLFTRYNFIRIESITSFWEEPDEGSRASYDQGMEDVLTGLFSQKLSFVYIIHSYKNRISVLLGTSDIHNRVLKSTFLSAFPGTRFHLVSELEKNEFNKIINSYKSCAKIFGTPTNKTLNQSGSAKTQIEKIIRGLSGESWVYVVCAEPLPKSEISAKLNQTSQDIRNSAIQFRMGGSFEEENRLGKNYIDLLKIVLEKFQVGRIKGCWNVDSYIVAHNQDLLNLCSSVLVSTFNGEESFPDRFRSCTCLPNPDNQVFDNINNTDQLAILTQIPREEFPGFAVKGSSKFGVELSQDTIIKPILIGEILDRGNKTKNNFSIGLEQLSKHGLIVGVTGSGKTNTCLNLLTQVWGTYKKPFLVIESAKSEYRELLNHPGFTDCIVFTLGDDTVSPFRLNPFEVPVGILVQSHIDYLKSLFNASFVLYAPMPYVLEQCIHEIYVDKGWDLATNTNERGYEHHLAYPTLDDLYFKIEKVVKLLDYDPRISMDIVAGLKARINNLRIGGKGLMLNTRWSLPEKDLFERPIILELKNFVNDDEKAFVIGIILIRLYEYYEAQFRTEFKTSIGEFRHLTLIEEAHRLLKNIPTESLGEETANPKGKAIETFTNMLSEIRAYGEGMIIAEQIPAKLTPDAIKNTNLKIIQRIVASDDRELMGETINLNSHQKQFISTLPVGEGLAYYEGLHKPFWINIPNFNEKNTVSRIRNDAIKQRMKQYFDDNPKFLLKYNHCKDCSSRTNQCSEIYNETEKILNRPEYKIAFSRLFTSIVQNKNPLISFQDLYTLISQLTRVRSKNQVLNVIYCALNCSGEKTFESRGNYYQIPFKEIERLTTAFNQLIKLMVFKDLNGDQSYNELNLENQIQQLSDDYKQICRRELLPFSSCRNCKNQCQFRYEISMIMNEDSFFNERFRNAFFDKGEKQLIDISIKAGKVFVHTQNDDILKGAAYCFAVHNFANIGLTIENQEELCEHVRSALINQTVD